MAWFQKFLGLGKKENTVLTLKCRLNRWRHFLRTEWACSRLLADLREKHQGEYIFDRQYVFSTVGQLFHQAYQAVYDGLLLNEDLGGELFLRLDRSKEEIQRFLLSFSKGNGGPNPYPSQEPSGSGTLVEEEVDLDQEPEFQMLKGVLEILDPEADTRPWPQKIEEIETFRMALQWIHQQVVGQFINSETIQHWMKTGRAYPITGDGGLSFYLIDLEMGATPEQPYPQETRPLEGKPFSSRAWTPLREALSVSLRDRPRNPQNEPTPLFLILAENALFLYGHSSAGTILLDMVLTSVRELNHFFLRWEGKTDDPLFVQQGLPLWDWTVNQDNKGVELVVCQRPSGEIERYGRQIGQTLASW